MENKWTDSPVAIFLGHLGDLLALNMLCLLCSIPVITIGASVSAMYSVLFKQRRDPTCPTIRTFFASFKDNFLPATAIEGIILVLGVLCWGDAKYALSVEGNQKTIFLVVATIIGMVALLLFTLGLPQVANFKNSVKKYVVNSFALAMCAPGWLVLIWLLWGAVIALPFCFFEFVMTYLGILYFLFGLSFPAFVTTIILSKVFERFE